MKFWQFFFVLIAHIPLGSSRHVSTRLDTFDVSSPCIWAVWSLLNSMARHVERVESCRDVTWRAKRNLSLCEWFFLRRFWRIFYFLSVSSRCGVGTVWHFLWLQTLTSVPMAMAWRHRAADRVDRTRLVSTLLDHTLVGVTTDTIWPTPDLHSDLTVQVCWPLRLMIM